MGRMLETRNSRRWTATAAILLLSAGSVRAFRGSYKPYFPEAPAYRQQGPSDAKAVLAVFSDFQCPGCAQGVEAVKHLESLYPGVIRVVYKHHPWWFHPHARQAAVLVECAGKQGKFWELHDRLFEHQDAWAQSGKPEELFSRYAAEAKLDAAALSACRKDPSMEKILDADLKEADEHWVASTPTFFLNGRRLAGLKQLRTTGVEELDRITKGGKGAS